MKTIASQLWSKIDEKETFSLKNVESAMPGLGVPVKMREISHTNMGLDTGLDFIDSLAL